MADLNHLKVDSVPSAFAEWAKKHNELVDLIAAFEAGSGMDIKITHAPQKKLSVPGAPGKTSKLPKGRVVFSAKPTWTGPIPGSGGSTGNTAQAVGTSGLLIDVLQPLSPNAATNYPNVMRVGDVAANSATIDTATITHQMTVRTFVGCNSGNAANYQVLASDFF